MSGQRLALTCLLQAAHRAHTRCPGNSAGRHRRRRTKHSCGSAAHVHPSLQSISTTDHTGTRKWSLCLRILAGGTEGAHPSSKRTWSLPLPVAPCDTASAPTAVAISICFLAISGRAIDVPSRYTPSYSAFALRPDAQARKQPPG